MTTKINCKSCNEISRLDDCKQHCVFAGSLEEPAEWETLCPHCGSDQTEELTTAYCRSCGDVVVSDYGEQCSECYTCEKEALFDAMMDR
jgi:hypothetical protein